MTDVKAKGKKAAVEKSPAAKSTGKKKGKMDEDDQKRKPPQPITAYIYFSNETVPRIKAERGCTHSEAFKLVGTEWNKLSEEAKAPFVQKSNEDKARYEEQLKMFKSEGYFMLADGTKSTDYDLQERKRKVKSGVVKDLLSPADASMALGKRNSDGTAVKNKPEEATARKQQSSANKQRKPSSAAAK